MGEANQLNSLTEEDIEIIAYVSAKVGRQLDAIKEKYDSPKEYSKSLARQFSHKDNIIALSLLYNIGNLDPNSLYKTEDLRNIATEQLHGDATDNNLVISYNDINRALEELNREICLEHFDTKEKIRRIQRIKFSGSPSAYRLPNEVSILKILSSKPVLKQLIIRSLKRMDLVDNLAYLLEGSFSYLTNEKLNEETKDNTEHLFISAAKSSPFIQLKEGETYGSSLESYTKLISSIDDEMRPKLAKEMAERMVEIPDLCYPFLLSFLSKSP